jgi:hypothetical protein
VDEKEGQRKEEPTTRGEPRDGVVLAVLRSTDEVSLQGACRIMAADPSRRCWQ